MADFTREEIEEKLEEYRELIAAREEGPPVMGYGGAAKGNMPVTVRLTVQRIQPTVSRIKMTRPGWVKIPRKGLRSDVHVVIVVAIPTSVSYMVCVIHYNHR